MDVDSNPGLSERAAARLRAVAQAVEDMVQERTAKPVIINVSPQGYHERSKRLVMSLTDTGGQDQYIENIAEGLAQKGFYVVNVNRSGPLHPINKDLRLGFHMYRDGVDLLFIDDGNPDFVIKEQMYDQFIPQADQDGFERLCRVESGPCHKLAADMLRKLGNLPHVELIIGHYADGGETARLFNELLIASGKEAPELWHIPHSTSRLKEETLQKSGHPDGDLARFNFVARAATEEVVYSGARVFSTSDAITHSVVDHYGGKVVDQIPIGVETDKFHPLPAGVERNDPRYDKIWAELSAISGRPVADLQGAEMVLEYSRTVPTKGKETVIKAFAESINGSDVNRILVISIGDPDSKGLSPNDQAYARNLRQLVKDLGLEGKVIYKDSFPNGECAKLCQLAHVFVSGATMETWGMAVQEAASSGLPVISSSIVPIAEELLVGKERSEQTYPNGAKLVKGAAAWMFAPGDYVAAGQAIRELFAPGKESEELRAAMGQSAHAKLIPAYTWDGILQRLMQNHGGFMFNDEGRVVWARETPGH
jgi:glycosyltransferase involved in cell wall biosynthesis